jgi:D-alanine-D-alanine ligase
VVFLRDEPGYWPILSYDAKWTENHAEYDGTDYHFKADLTPELEAKIEAVAKRAFRLLGCRDYARVDLRIRKGDDLPMILELNPNPDFAPERAFANNLWAAGLSHAEFTVQMVRNALARKGPAVPPRYSELQAG